MKIRVLAFVGAALVAGVLARPAQAAPIIGASVFATGGDVIATFEFNGAGYTNDLYLDSPANALGLIFRNTVTPAGTSVNLGNFAAGTELIFKIFVNNTGDSFYTGPGSRNPDGIAHASVDDALIPGKVVVGFEDLLGGGDLDYNDLVFSFTNTSREPNPVPEPASMALLGSGLAGLALRVRRRRKA